MALFGLLSLRANCNRKFKDAANLDHASLLLLAL